MNDTETYQISWSNACSSAAIKLPLSKSISNRALTICAIGGLIRPQSLAVCDDTAAMIYALEHTEDAVIDVGAAGTAMRFLTAFYATTAGCHTITGSERMLCRPIGELVEALRCLGADIVYLQREGFPPLKINGRKLCGGRIVMDGSISSQFVSAILMIAPTLTDDLIIQLCGKVASRPYIDMTLRLMQSYGIDAGWSTDGSLYVKHGQYQEAQVSIEADWSAASYWYETVALAPEEGFTVRLEGLTDKSLQGDSRVVKIYRQIGVATQFLHDSRQTVLISKIKEPQRRLLQVDFSDCPDLAQAVIVTCVMLRQPFVFTGLDSLAIKETNRGLALQTELRKMGAEIELDGGTISFCPTSNSLHTATISTYNDHRMAMVFAPTALRIGTVCIDNPSVVSKSYPQFWHDMQQVGFNVQTQL